MIHICGPRIYKYQGRLFQVSAHDGPWPLCKNGNPMKRCPKDFLDFYYNLFCELPKDIQEEFRIGGGCQTL
jgi:hypothetical protein